jgi:hypothetical protein
MEVFNSGIKGLKNIVHMMTELIKALPAAVTMQENKLY